MRITAVSTVNIGGVPDGTLELPEGAVAAFAGGNGTGKSKLLGCILSPWSGIVPGSDMTRESSLDVHMRLTLRERQALEEFSVAVSWGKPEIPEDVVVGMTRHPTAGLRRTSTPSYTVLQNAWAHQQFVQSQPSLNVVYLPAERRLLAPGTQGIDLNQLSEVMAWQKTAEPRNAVQNYGRLDDQEFEGFAKALCVAASLPSEIDGDTHAPEARTRWSEFQETVNAIIAPKKLLPLTREHPEQLRIETPSGDTHPVQDLSSGERQALIIISRVLRAGVGHTLVLIDEPDAYLHPHLSQRLVQALERGVGADGQLVVATHSPAVLDGLAPSSIIRLSHDERPRLVADEGERLDLYRAAGFRASTLTQSDLLMVAEGESDAPLLHLLFPDLARAAIRAAGGRARVLREVEQLAPYELPVLGVVDRDILAPSPPEKIRDLIIVWPTGDIEGVFLSDPAALEIMIARGLVKSEYQSVEALQSVLQGLLDSQRDNVVAELAQRRLRESMAWDWPTPKGDQPIERLCNAVRALRPVSADECTEAIAAAERTWDEQTPDSKWQLVRAKYIANHFASRATEMRSGRALLEAVARERPNLAGLQELRAKLDTALG